VEAYVNDLSNDVHWRTGVTESRWHSDEPFAVGSIGYTYVGDKVAEWRGLSLTLRAKVLIGSYTAVQSSVLAVIAL